MESIYADFPWFYFNFFLIFPKNKLVMCVLLEFYAIKKYYERQFVITVIKTKFFFGNLKTGSRPTQFYQAFRQQKQQKQILTILSFFLFKPRLRWF